MTQPFQENFSGERRYLPVQVNQENIEVPVVYDIEKFPQISHMTKEEHKRIVDEDFSGAVAQAVYLYENDLHDFTIPNSLKEELKFCNSNP